MELSGPLPPPVVDDSYGVGSPERKSFKRKEIPNAYNPFQTTVFDEKRRREANRHASTWPKGLGSTLTPCLGGTRLGAEEGDISSKSIQSSVCPGVLDDRKVKAAGKCSSVPNGTASLGSGYASGLANESTLTSSSTEDGQSSRPDLQGSGQSRQAKIDTVSGSRTWWAAGGHDGNHRNSHRERWRSPRNPEHGDGEAQSPPPKTFANKSPPKEEKRGKTFGWGPDDIGSGNGDEKSEIACVVDSGGSIVDDGMGKATRKVKDSGFHNRRDESITEGLHSICPKDLVGSSAVADPASSSDSLLTGISSLYTLYQPRGQSTTKKLPVGTAARKTRTCDNALADGARPVELITMQSAGLPPRSRAVPRPSPTGVSEYVGPVKKDLGSKETTNLGGFESPTLGLEARQLEGKNLVPIDNGALSDGVCPEVERDAGQHGSATFVLSSGRLSKDQSEASETCRLSNFVDHLLMPGHAECKWGVLALPESPREMIRACAENAGLLPSDGKKNLVKYGHSARQGSVPVRLENMVD